MNFYELFGIPVSPWIDKDKLQLKYFMLQRKFHPDYYTDRTEEERAHALEKSAQVNDAFNTFSDSQKSLAYFLEQKGEMGDAESYRLPPDFLIQMMDLNELLDEGNREAYQTGVRAAMMENEDELKVLVGRSELEWSGEELDKLKACYFRKKYLNRLLDRLND